MNIFHLTLYYTGALVVRTSLLQYYVFLLPIASRLTALTGSIRMMMREKR